MLTSNYKHSIRFGDGTLDGNGRFKGYDTYKDWHLIPSSRPTIAMPGVETKFVTIPGLDGALDLSQFIRKDRPAFGNRAGTFEFNVENDHEFWMSLYPQIVNVLHGKQFKMVLNEDDPDYFWEGRFSIDKHEPSDGSWSIVSISYQVGPFKWKIRNGNDNMVWDNFNFEKDYDNCLEQGYVYANNGFVRIDVTGADANTRVIIGNENVSLQNRTRWRIIRPVNGKVRIALTGNGTMTWREGSL